jgi:hypothetical protein
MYYLCLLFLLIPKLQAMDKINKGNNIFKKEVPGKTTLG